MISLISILDYGNPPLFSKQRIRGIRYFFLFLAPTGVHPAFIHPCAGLFWPSLILTYPKMSIKSIILSNICLWSPSKIRYTAAIFILVALFFYIYVLFKFYFIKMSVTCLMTWFIDTILECFEVKGAAILASPSFTTWNKWLKLFEW